MTIEQISFPLDDVVGFRIEGKISADDISRITEAIEARLERHRKLRIYAEGERLSGMIMEALIKDLAFSLRHFSSSETNDALAWIMDRR